MLDTISHCGSETNGRFNAWIESYSGKSASVNVPASVGDCDMVGIDNNCFSFNKTLKTIVVPKGIAEIGSSAFLGCTALTSVSLPSTLDKNKFLGNLKIVQAFDTFNSVKQLFR